MAFGAPALLTQATLTKSVQWGKGGVSSPFLVIQGCWSSADSILKPVPGENCEETVGQTPRRVLSKH